MSIFKETLDPGIQTQLKARTLVVSGENNNRSGLLPWYLSKNAWVRMTSFVNFTEGTIYFDGVGSVKVDPTTGHYKGDKLSKKYILEGGTLNTNLGTSGNQTLGSLRYGVATANAVYGSNIDLRTDGTADPNYFRQLGLRPMPGITDVKMRTIGAYGSLFETTVNFHAWDTHQLNELEILFMRPGYSVLLEWGWSQYINYNDQLTGSKDTLTQNQIEPTVFNGQTINPFNDTLTPENVSKELERLRQKHRYNYDGMLGYIKNFNWKLRRDGGYDCSTTLISMGEVINTIKMNTSANQTILGSYKIPDGDEASSYVYDDYENVLLSLKSSTEQTYEPQTTEDGITVSSPNTFISESAYAGSWEHNINYINFDSIKKTLELNGYQLQADSLGLDETTSTTTGLTTTTTVSLANQPYYQELETTEENISGTRYEYLTLDVVLAIISSYTNIKSRNKDTNYPFVKILVPTDNDFCLAGKDSISVQPSICNIYNPGAFKEEIGYFLFNSNFNDKKTTLGVVPTISKNNYTKPFYDPAVKAGRINRILVNIDLLLNVYKDLKGSSNESGVVMTDYLKNILNKISNALGGLNNFTLSTAGRDQNTLRIIDTYYFGQEKKDNTYQFDLLGLGSICKDVSIQSQIFQEQSTIVAIAAQSKANLGDVYNSTQVYLNAGLEDRLALAKWQGSEINATAEADPENDPFYVKLAQLMAYARTYLIGYTRPGDINGTITTVESGEDPHTLLKQALLRYDGEMNFKALIPFKLRITLEGIGGIVVGQIFTVKQNVLPKNYYDKRLGFIVTQIEHVLNNNQWETVLDTQICILDQQDFYDASGLAKLTNNIKRKGFGEFLRKRQVLGIIWPVLMDFMIYQATRSLVGFVYASEEDIAMKSIKTNLETWNQTNVDDYWKNNVGKFTNRYASSIRGNSGTVGSFTYSPSNTFANYNINNNTNYTRVYPLIGDGFEQFFINWCKIWKEQNASILNERFSDTKTFGDVIDFISDRNVFRQGSNELEFKNFNLYLDEAKALMSTISLEVFYPNTNPISIYENNGKIDFISDSSVWMNNQLVQTSNNAIISYFTGLRGWSHPKIKERVTKALLSQGNDKIQILWNNYTSPVAVGGIGSTRSLAYYFYHNSSVMYGKDNSLVIPNSSVSLTGDVVNSFAFNALINRPIRSFETLKYPKDDNSGDKSQTWANTIDWDAIYRENINDPSTEKNINGIYVGTESGKNRIKSTPYYWNNFF